MNEISFLLCLVFITVIFTLRFCRLHDRIRELELKIDMFETDLIPKLEESLGFLVNDTDKLSVHVFSCIEHLGLLEKRVNRIDLWKEEETK